MILEFELERCNVDGFVEKGEMFFIKFDVSEKVEFEELFFVL